MPPYSSLYIRVKKPFSFKIPLNSHWIKLNLTKENGSKKRNHEMIFLSVRYSQGCGILCSTPRTVSVSPAWRMSPRDLMLLMVCLNSNSLRSLVASYAIRTRPGMRGWSLIFSTVTVELDDDISWWIKSPVESDQNLETFALDN